MNKNVLVTSCGGDIGQSIGKILKALNCTTFGLDISDKNAAKFIFDYFEVGLRVTDENYISSIEQFVKKHKIDLIIPISEAELRFYTKNYLDTLKVGGVDLLMANHLARVVGFDKGKTCSFLKEHALPNPKVYLSSNEPAQFPLIAKPRAGSGSSNIFVIKNQEEFNFFFENYKHLIFQELLDGTAGEFTCCVYRSRSGITRVLILKRELMGGFSGYGEVVENQKIKELLDKLADLLNLEGSINVQLRMHKDEPVIFEINPRFSSTVLFRHMLGFYDLQWSLEDKFNLPISDYSKPEKGAKFYKGFQEYIG
ncbi:ATP-grasp domain-containing protein [Aureispira anguillae]|uniref:ATP-grasp domain-containing protein n=1 Tax=Aureispira anguillae TaxID=2864201 RepID=A0A915YJJ4_9BACT|nr:ATP-grasp domain-containing protein [Aureispira anguillae]BDS14368.1 ATP-grasp domain-containing protein [Aureispira anguillae]